MKKRTAKDRIKAYPFGGETEKGRTPITYKTQAQVNAANMEAKRIAKAKGLLTANTAYAARNVGDAVVPYVNPDGTPYIPLPTKPKATTVPEGVDLQSGQGQFWYTDPTTGDNIDVDYSVANLPRFRTPVTTTTKPDLLAKKSFATGGISGTNMGIASQIPGIADAVMSLFENNPNNFSEQPIVNASAMRGMVNPYKNFALGGEMDEDQLAQLQAMAEEQGVTVEELIEMIESGQLSNEEDISNDEAVEIMDEEQEDFKYGGKAGKRIEVEGKEAIETPSGKIGKIHGPKHEKGGVNINVPDGTKIFSDRIKIDGKTMAERKLAREKTMARLEKLSKKNPFDKLLRATIQRTSETAGYEDEKDMQVQKLAAKIYNSKADIEDIEPEEEFAIGGISGDPDNPYFDKTGWGGFDLKTILQAGYDPTTMPPGDFGNASPAAVLNPANRAGITGNFPPADPSMAVATPDGGNLTLGDTIGIAGNAFNAIAPLMNTRANARANKPNVNRWQGFGREALDANTKAQDTASGLRTSAITDIDTSANSARNRNRNSASSVNTIRALDATTDQGSDKAKVAANDNFAKQMINLMGQRSQLENVQDTRVMAGETARDIEDKADTDNYFTNKAQNLVNLGTNVQGIGRNLNVAHSNKVDSRLLGQLSKYGLQFDEDGNLISVR